MSGAIEKEALETYTRFVALRDEIGAFGTLLYTGHDWLEPALARRSMELMATEVWPRVAEAAASRTSTAGLFSRP